MPLFQILEVQFFFGPLFFLLKHKGPPMLFHKVRMEFLKNESLVGKFSKGIKKSKNRGNPVE